MTKATTAKNTPAPAAPPAAASIHVLFPRTALLNLLKLALPVIDAKSPMPALNNVLIHASSGKITVTATDLYRSVFGVVDEAVATSKPGSIALPAKGLYQRIEAMPEGPVELTVEDVAVVVKSGVRKALSYKMTGVPASEYPVVAIPAESMVWTTVPGDAARTVLDKTLFTASDDHTRPFINCVYLVAGSGKLTGYSADGHRVSRMAVDVEEIAALALMVPKAGAEHLRKVVDEAVAAKKPVEIGVSGPDCFFRVGNVRYSVKLFEEKPFPYDRVLPESATYRARLPRVAMLASVKAMMLTADDKSSQITLAFAGNELTLSAKDATKGEGTDVLAIDYSGDPFTVSFFAPYVIDALARIDGDEIIVDSDGPPASLTDARPTVFRAAAPVEGHAFVTVIAPAM